MRESGYADIDGATAWRRVKLKKGERRQEVKTACFWSKKIKKKLFPSSRFIGSKVHGLFSSMNSVCYGFKTEKLGAKTEKLGARTEKLGAKTELTTECFGVICGMTIIMHQALSDRANRPDQLVASGAQVEMRFKRGQKVLSLRAQKMWHLLIKAAGVNLAEDIKHCIPLADFYEAGIGHMTLDERVETLRELQVTLVEVTVGSPKIKGGLRVVTGALLSSVERDLDDRGDLEWTFSPALRLVFANSEHWAVLSKRAVMAFESRYSLRLYEIIALRSGLDHKTSETFDIESLRARLGVPVDKMHEWFDLRRFALEPAIAEVNQLAGFKMSYEAIKRGRSVAAVKLVWDEKSGPERAAAKRELEVSKTGRKARRGAIVEIIEPEPRAVSAPATAFPADGSISFGPWGKLVRENAPFPTPDVDLVASMFRKNRAEAGRSLAGKDVESHFVNFCKRWKRR